MAIFRKKISSLTQMPKIIKKLAKQKGVSQKSLRNKARVSGDSILSIEY